MTKKLLSIATITMLAIPGAAHAQAFNPPAAKVALARACSGKSSQPISIQRLAEALIIQGGLFPSEMASGGENLSEIIWKLSDPNAKSQGYLERQMVGAVASLESALRKKTIGATAFIQNIPRNKHNWLFDPTQSWTIQCGGEPAVLPDIVRDFGKDTPFPSLALRGSVDDLTDKGEDRFKSSSLKLGASRTRFILDDGSVKTDTSLTINGTLGLRLTPAHGFDDVIHAFASYSLSRDRSRPAASLPVGVGENDGDTDSLEVGLAGKFEITSNESVFKLFAGLNASVLNDFVHNSRIGRLGLTIEPGINPDLVVCKFGSFKTLLEGSNGLYARCGGQLEIEGAHVFKVGTAEFGVSDEYLAVGFNASYELFSPTFGDDGIFAKARYRYLPVIHGDLRNIRRFEAEAAYRIWSASEIGFDVGLTYARGSNPKSFEKENILIIGLGVLF